MVIILPPPQIIAFDELKTDYKNPIDQCNTLNPVSDPAKPDAPSLPLTACRNALSKGLIYFRIILSAYLSFSNHFSALLC